MAQELALDRGGEVGIGIAEEAGEVVGGGAAAHALVVDHDGLGAAEEDVAGLPVAVKEGLGGAGEEAGNRLEFCGDGENLFGGGVLGAAQDVVGEVGVFPGVEFGTEAGHEGKAAAAGGGESFEMQAQGEVENLSVQAEEDGGCAMGQARFKGVGT